MKSFTLFLVFLLISGFCLGQDPAHMPNQKAQAYYSQALNKYSKYLQKKDSMVVVFHLLDNAIKEDKYFFNAYSEKVAFLCQLEEYKKASIEMKKMADIFTSDVFVNLLNGALETKTGKVIEAKASYIKVIQLVDHIPENKRKGDIYNNLVSDKAIAMILSGKMNEGKSLLQKLYDNEKSQVAKSRLAGYLNCTTIDQILDNVIPGKWS